MSSKSGRNTLRMPSLIIQKRPLVIWCRYWQQKHEVQLVESIPKTKVVDGKLAVGDLFEVALINYLVIAKGNEKSELFADRLEESLLKLIGKLKADDSSRLISERLESRVRGAGISKNKERLVNVQPVQNLSSQPKVIIKPYNPLIFNLNQHEKAAFRLLKDVGLDKVDTDIFNSQKFRVWSNQIKSHFPFEKDEGASIMLTTLAKLYLEKLAKSIPTTELKDGKLSFGDHFEVALKNYIANAKGNAEFDPIADRLEEALLALIVRLKEDEESKTIADRLEHLDNGDLISNSKKKVGNVDNVQPVQTFSSQHKVISKPVISLTPGLSYNEASAFALLKNVGLDKVETDIFNSDQFQKWLEQMEIMFSRPEKRAEVMLTTLAKSDNKKFVASIPTTKFEDDKLAFGDHFKEALMDFIAKGADVEYVKDSYKSLKKSVLELINNLKSGEHSSFGEILEGEFLFTQLSKNMEGLFDILDDLSVQKWYFSMETKNRKEALEVLDRRLKLQKINSKRIGEVIGQDRDNFTKNVFNDLVVYKRWSQFDMSQL
ncbi:uncharacterized protein PHALS_11756 [Plasmopara halstedii]|uniref:Uncharacterized protein n=1 Tax=Plasmopara halstedii TaxID=4781 RepID=A0A0P1AJM8_PLAHL|nr:uncharacterized protein PHALS_11756 [Plasmopara halstedii]CEG41406.1 hypothetical protein PHALS_11756 [Plasmopara halstedii]|eukprot:XP_024577775.1 hypothetical protein PHALS_11756 [Plasmopara halstedii]